MTSHARWSINPSQLFRKQEEMPSKLLKEVGEDSTATMQMLQHFDTGFLRGSTDGQMENDTRYRITVGAEYAIHEMNRGGSHNFMEQTIDVIKSDIIKDSLKRLSR